MFNPDKQTRGANGRFGAKKVEAEIEDVAEAVVAVGREVVEAVEASYKSINEQINSAGVKPGQFVVIDPFDYGVTNRRTGYVLLAIAVLAIIAGFIIL
jgi:hypothetical protein